MLKSEALKILINEKESTENSREFAFKILAETIADDECNECKMTYEEWQHLCNDYKTLFKHLYNNNEKYLKSKN